MAKRQGQAEFNDNDNINNGDDQRALFIDTSLNTHLILLVSPFDTFSILKQKMLLEHPKCFPDFGEIEINALKVKRKGCYYHLLDSMLVKVAFHGVSKNWFLFVDASSKMACVQNPMNGLALVAAGLTKPPATLVDSSKLLMSNNFHCDDDFEADSYKTEKKSHPEMPQVLGFSTVQDECNPLDNSLKPRGSSGKKRKSRKKNDSSEQHHEIVDKNPANTCMFSECSREMEHVISMKNSALQPKGMSSDVDHKTSGNGDVQSLGQQGRFDTVDFDDHGKTLPSGHKEVLNLATLDSHFNNESKESLATDNHIKSVGDDTKFKNIVDDETFPDSPVAKKKRKVANGNAQDIPLLDTKSVISEPNRLISEPESVTKKSDGEGMQNSGLVDLNGLSSKVRKTSKVTRKRKKGEHANQESMYSDMSKKENMEETQHHAQKASSMVIDEVSKVESVQESVRVQSLALHMEDAGNKLVKDDVRNGAFQLEGAGTSLPELSSNEKGIDNVGLASGSRAKKTKKVKKGVGVDGSHPTASSKVTDILTTAVYPSENEKRLNDSEQDNTKATGAEKTVQLNFDPKPLSEQEPLTPVERQMEEEIAPLKSSDVKDIVESENTHKKKKTKQAKNSVIKMSELYSTEDHQDSGNYISTNGSVDDNDRCCPTNEGNGGRDASQTLDVKGIVESENTHKKKKTKKAKNSVIEKSELHSTEDHQAGNHISTNGSAEDNDRRCPTNEGDSGEDASQTLDVKGIGESENTTKKKKTKKAKNSVIEKSELYSAKDHQDAGNHTSTNASAEDNNRYCPINEGNTGEDASPADKAKLINEIVEPGTRAKKKKGKKLKNSAAEKPNLSIMENSEDYNKLKLVDKADTVECITRTDVTGDLKSKAATISSQIVEMEADDIQQIGVESLRPAEVNKPGIDVENMSNKLKKRVLKKHTDISKDHREFPLEQQLGDIARDPQAGCDLLSNSNDKGTEQQRGEDGDIELNMIPTAEISAGVAEVKKLAKPHATKKKAKNLNSPSSNGTSAAACTPITSKKNRGTEKTESATQLQGDDRKTEDMRDIGTESLRPSQVVEPKENVEIRSEKPIKSAQRKQTIVKNTLELPVEKQLREELSEVVPKSAVEDLMDTDVSDSKRQKEVSAGKNLCEEFDPVPEVSPDMRNLNKPQASKEGGKKLDVPSSVDTSSNGPNLSKLKKSKGTERTSEDGTEFSKSTSELKHKPQSSAKRPSISKQGMKTQVVNANSLNSDAKVALAHNQSVGAKKDGIRVASIHGGSKSSGASSVSSGNSVRRNGLKKKAKELQKKPDIHVGSRTPAHKNMGEVVNAVAQREGLLVTPGAIFEDESASSDGESIMDRSGSSTRTPSVSSSDYSEGESRGIVVTSAHGSLNGGEKNTNPNMSGSERPTLETILRSSSRYKKAKLIAAQSQLEDGESQPIEFVPDSQAN